MAKTEVIDLLNAGVHFGHLTRKWNPNMAPYIYMERNGIHIINLYKTAVKIQETNAALKKIATTGRKILFVATKKQAKDIVAEKAKSVNMPYITERWPGGMLTNFVTIRKAVKKMAAIDRMKKDGTFETLSKKERLQVDRLRSKLEKNLGSISEMTRLPGAIFIVDTTREHIAVKEAKKLKIPIFASFSFLKIYFFLFSTDLASSFLRLSSIEVFSSTFCFWSSTLDSSPLAACSILTASFSSVASFSILRWLNPSDMAEVTKSKILLTDFDASSFDGIT